jgi:hypothetical protein
MKLTTKGFRLTFTQKMNQDALKDVSNYTFLSYTYTYRKKYGSPQVKKKKIKVTGVKLLDGGRAVDLELAELIEERVFQLDMQNLVSFEGQKLSKHSIYYTLNKRLD